MPEAEGTEFDLDDIDARDATTLDYIVTLFGRFDAVHVANPIA